MFISGFLAVFQLIAITAICFYEFKNKSSAVFLWATLLLMFGIMHFISVFSGKYNYSVDTMNRASLFVISFCAIYYFTRKIVSAFLQKKTKRMMRYDVLCEDLNESEGRLKVFVAVLIVLTILNFRHMSSISGGLINSSWTSWREYTTSREYISIDTIETIAFNSLGGLSCYCILAKKKIKFSICILCILASVLVTRNRVLVIPALVSVISVAIFKLHHIKIKTIVLGLVGAVIVVYIVYGIRVFRHYGSIGQFTSEFSLSGFINRINEYLLTDNGELGLREYFYYYINNDNNFQGFGTGAGYIRMLLVYVPTRFSFGLKPDDFAQTMGAAVGKAAGGSMHPTLFGDCYANLGWIGVFLGLFWALYATFQDIVVLRFKKPFYRVLAFCLIGGMYVIQGRGAVYNAFFNVAWGVPFLAALNFLETHKKKIRFTVGNKYIQKSLK